MVEHPPAMQETWVQSLGWEDPLEEGMATHSRVFLPGESPWMEEFGRLQSMCSQRVRHNWAALTHSLTQFSNTRKWHDVIQSIFSNRGWNGKACVSINEYLFWSSVEVLIMLWVFDLEPDSSTSMREFHRRSNEQTTRHSLPDSLCVTVRTGRARQWGRGQGRVQLAVTRGSELVKPPGAGTGSLQRCWKSFTSWSKVVT